MSRQTKKRMAVVIGIVMFAAGFLMIWIGPIETSSHTGPNGGTSTEFMSLFPLGLLLVIVGPLITLRGVLSGHVPKWIA